LVFYLHLFCRFGFNKIIKEDTKECVSKYGTKSA
jgi:hypothetical protein